MVHVKLTALLVNTLPTGSVQIAMKHVLSVLVLMSVQSAESSTENTFLEALQMNALRYALLRLLPIEISRPVELVFLLAKLAKIIKTTVCLA